MASHPSFTDLLARLRAGDEDAAERIFRRYSQQLIAVAYQQLDTLIRQKVDPEDVVQSVFRSFFRRVPEGAWELDSWASLWRLLTAITLHKCGHRIEHFHAARRDVRREVSLSPGISKSAPDWEAIAREPTPSEAAALSETVEQLMRDLSPRDRTILELVLQGETVAAIAVRLSLSERTVERVLERVRKRLQRWRDEKAASS